MNSKTARIHFYGNLKLIGEREADPERYNLYFGLAKLAEAVSDVDRRVQLLREEVAALRAEIRKGSPSTPTAADSPSASPAQQSEAEGQAQATSSSTLSK
jgi:hypothetical protein